MPFSSGVYSPPSSPGAFNPATSGQAATPTAWNALLADISTALSTTILKDGTQAVTADIPFANHKLTGLANGTAATDAATVGQVASGVLNGTDDTGIADAYVIDPAVGILAYAAYQAFSFKALHTNTTTSTLAVSGLAAKTIKHLDGSNLLAADILAGELVQVMYDGTNFQLLSPTGLRGTASTWTAAQTFNAATTFAATAAASGAALNEAKGADLASATTTNIGAVLGNYVHITGTTTITAFDTVQAGTRRILKFDGILTLTYDATALILPTAANITTAAGDVATFVSEGSGNWRCVNYQRATGAALTPALTSATATMAVDVNLDNTANYFTGPTIANPGSGTFLVVAHATTNDLTSGGVAMYARLTDGTTVFASGVATPNPAGSAQASTIELSGVITNPAGALKMEVRDATTTAGTIFADATGNGKDTAITWIRIA